MSASSLTAASCLAWLAGLSSTAYTTTLVSTNDLSFMLSIVQLRRRYYGVLAVKTTLIWPPPGDNLLSAAVRLT